MVMRCSPGDVKWCTGNAVGMGMAMREEVSGLAEAVVMKCQCVSSLSTALFFLSVLSCVLYHTDNKLCVHLETYRLIYIFKFLPSVFRLYIYNHSLGQ